MQREKSEGKKKGQRLWDLWNDINITYFNINPTVTSEGEEERGEWDEDILEEITFKNIANFWQTPNKIPSILRE